MTPLTSFGRTNDFNIPFVLTMNFRQIMTQSYLNIQNINNSNSDIEYHPLIPCVDRHTKVLFLGSFPPQRVKWAKGFDFYYPNFINDHWRIMGLIYYNDKNHFVDLANKTYQYEKILSFVKEKGLGYYDTSEAVRRLKNNASDKFLEVVTRTDIAQLVEKCDNCEAIITTGEKATQNLCEQFRIQKLPKIGQPIPITSLQNKSSNEIMLHRLPSSSRAYPMNIEAKAEFYKNVLLNIIAP